jgi:segregation and condensation protein A
MAAPEAAAVDRAAKTAVTARAAALARLGAAPEVVFDEGRVETATHVRTAGFDGPLALLLAVIEARQLDVLTVPLGGLAEAYLEALATLEGDRLGNVSGFVAVAAQLILIKSRAILPRQSKVAAVPLDEEPDPEAELRARLIEYRRYRDAGAALGERFGVHRLFRRDAEVAASAGKAGARPPERPPLPPTALTRALDRLAKIVPPPQIATQIVARTITLAERMAVIRAALSEADQVVLQELLGGVHDRVVVAVTFLAMLELSKRREITLAQAEPWGPIIARRLTEAAEIVIEVDVDESLGSFA